MDDDIGSQLADVQAERDYYAERNMCPDCEAKYDENGNCSCEDEL